MGKWVLKVFKNRIFLNIASAALLIIIYNGLKNARFEEIDYFVRDALQFLNSPDEVDKSIVTLTININSDGIVMPHTYESMKKVIDKIQEYSPRNIIVMMEPLDFSIDIENKKKLFKYFTEQKNLYLNSSDARNPVATFDQDPIFKNFERPIEFDRCIDSPKGKENRRAFLAFDSLAPIKIFDQLKSMGLNPKPISFYKYSFDYWNTTQAYIKNYPLGTFGNYQTKELFRNNFSADVFKGKTVVIGINDEFSLRSSRSTFNLLGRDHHSNQSAFRIPLQDIFANIISFHTTGSYIKYFKSFDDLLLTLTLLFLILALPFSSIFRLYLFLSTLPLLLVSNVIIYILGCFYIDFSRSIVVLIALQYIALPIVFLFYFRRSEQKKLADISNARIDALLSISESVAHDIRSPLSTINLLITKANFSDPSHKHLITTAVNRIESITEGLLLKYKNSNSILYVKLNLKDVLEAIASEKKILHPSVVFDFIITNEVFLHADKTSIERVISNIVDNSIEAMTTVENKRIVIRVIVSNDLVEIRIKDNGTGISPAILKLLGNQRTTTKVQKLSSGLGFLHSKRIIEDMGGSLQISSDHNLGTEVIICLPGHH